MNLLVYMKFSKMHFSRNNPTHKTFTTLYLRKCHTTFPSFLFTLARLHSISPTKIFYTRNFIYETPLLLKVYYDHEIKRIGAHSAPAAFPQEKSISNFKPRYVPPLNDT